MAEHESSLAVLVDFENMARPGIKGRGDFDIHLVLDRLSDKGHVLVAASAPTPTGSASRAYTTRCTSAASNSSRFPSAGDRQELGRYPLVVDAMSWLRQGAHRHVRLVSGDSDFSPLVSKLKESASTSSALA